MGCRAARHGSSGLGLAQRRGLGDPRLDCGQLAGATRAPGGEEAVE